MPPKGRRTATKKSECATKRSGKSHQKVGMCHQKVGAIGIVEKPLKMMLFGRFWRCFNAKNGVQFFSKATKKSEGRTVLKPLF